MNMEESFRWIIFFILIVLLGRLTALLSRQFNLPAVTVQLLIGILLGPSLLNLLGAPIILGTWGSPQPSMLHSALKVLAEIGLIQLMFLAGLQMDWSGLKSNIKTILSVSGWTFVLTTVGITISTRWFVDQWTEALALSAVMASSSFGILVHTFSQMRALELPTAPVTLNSGLLSGLLAILVMIASITINYATAFGGSNATIAVLWFLGKLILFFWIAYFLTSRFLKLITKNGAQKKPRQMLIGYLLLVAALYAWGTMHFGSFAAVGVASLGGALLGMSNLEVKERIKKGLESIMASIPIGFLFIVLGMEVNLNEVKGSNVFFGGLFIMGVITKSIGSWIGTNKVFESLHERFLTMFGTLPQGEMGILIAAYLFSRGLLRGN